MKKLLFVLFLFSASANAQVSSLPQKTCRILYSSAAASTTTGTTEQALYSYSVPANTLTKAGDYLEIETFGKKAANGNAQTSHLDYNGVTYAGDNNATSGLGRYIKLVIAYVSSSLVTFNQYEVRGTSVVNTDAGTISETSTSARTIALNVTTSVQAGDITYYSFSVKACTS